MSSLFSRAPASRQCRSYLLQQFRPPKRTYSSSRDAGGVPPTVQRPTRFSKYSRRLGYLALGGGALYAWDRYYNASAIRRNLRTLQTCAMITIDYKLNFTPGKSEQIPELHERVAERMYNLLTSNGGLYIKIGQAIGANAAMLPKPMQVKFASLFDDAPQIPYSVVRDVFIKELGRPPSGPGGVFEVFEETAVASASIAQVHKAKTWDGEWVAVKVQKPDVGVQMEWDLGAYRAVMWMFENWAFDLPVYFIVDFVSEHLRQELDFINEAKNAMQTAEFVRNEPSLRDRVHIPKVYPEYSTAKVMVAEWIEGVRLSDKAGIYKLMGEHEPHYNVNNLELNPMSATAMVAPSPQDATLVSTGYAFPEKPLKGGVKAIMQTMVELFSAQMFSWGWVHCDPHPGNIIVRPSPSNPTRPQLVLIDHGLYVRVPEDFKRQWVQLWRGMLAGDYKAVEEITKQWGMGLPDLVASFTLMKPTFLKRGRKPRPVDQLEKPRKQLSQYEMSVLMKRKLKEFLSDTDRMPKVLIFLIRNMRMVQGNNQSFGSPVNRIKITGDWASRSLFARRDLPLGMRVREWWHHVVFRMIMFSLDLAFWRSNFVRWVYEVRDWVLGKEGGVRKGGFEEDLERQMRLMAKDTLGVEVGEQAFSG
ncbi:ABC1 family-domain-containing protein [Ephemerocybe angulata]|uniref:ABC1 family-domain-containing protein n=1 Tax=Ephemerocybe angulata TaxID=980116 RepID=A0A8H6M854_9AGAR|nr:ABC1 family-domain-containing protein [Tulosesus angulatus]